MTYTIDCVAAKYALRYRVTLIIGRNRYVGTTVYEKRSQAARAAKSTGATHDDFCAIQSYIRAKEAGK